MESRLLGIPLVVWFFLIGLAVLVDGFIWFFVYTPEKHQLQALDYKASVLLQDATLVSPTPLASPSATVTPTTAPVLKFVAPKVEVTLAPTR